MLLDSGQICVHVHVHVHAEQLVAWDSLMST